MKQIGHPHLLQHIGAVVTGASVYGQSGFHSHLQHFRDSGNAGGKLHVGDRTVGHSGSRRCQKFQFLCVKMDSMSIPDIVSDPSQALHIGQRTHAVMLQGERLLVLRLRQVRMEADSQAAGQDR